ncbi:MAG: 4Fe-4S ferredoxin [Desulfobacterales bacterium]|jgi:formate dehydrogenase (coenzyme F420) beta subunit|nr:4Fe-4S ferredoxin [Desulfobacteraceae bacterium]MBT7085428.1 4Fe-4S ferredoxin [Desulfobacterales bacterium]MBT7697819.1 4Fe-4S ferredoxin [Desulfobacterales bacterium]
MLGYIDKIRGISEKLLTEEKVDMVIGFKKGTIPMMNEPFVARNASEVKDFVWDSNCGINLANYLTDRKETIGIIAKGCDSRSIVNHIIENKITREQLIIIGVPCKGMIDHHEISSMFDTEITEVTENGSDIIVKGTDFEETLKKDSFLQKNCKVCVHRNPVIHDELVADMVDEQKDVDRFEEVNKIEVMSQEEKWNYFNDLLSPCIRCYACRNACPLCFCPTCFVDESKPQWVGKGPDPVDTRTFHFLRAYHMVGRCTDCGSCVRACPMGIDVRAFTKKSEKDCFELYGWEAGLSIDKRPALETFKQNDPEDFIK